jgi:hypothetical protein
MKTLNTKPLSSRLRERLSEPAMLDLTQRLIAIPSENPPGNQYEECARTLFDELERLGFDDLTREGASVLAASELARGRSISAVTTMSFPRRNALNFSHVSKAQICSVAVRRT